MVLLSPLFSPLRVGGSSAYRRVRRVVAPAGESLWCSRNFASRSERTPAARTFVASNESNQSKDALHFAVPLRLLPSATCRLRTDSDHGTPVSTYPTTRLASHRLDDASGCCAPWRRGEARRGQGKFAKQTTVLLLGPVGGVEERRGLGPRAQHASSSDFARLSERSGRRPRSEFGARPQTPSTAEQSALGRPPPSGPPFFGDFLSGKRKKVTALSGAFPDAASRSEKNQRQSEQGLRYPTPNGPQHANKASTGSARTGKAP